MDICRECEQRHRHGEMDWPTDGHGEEYCRVHHGAHPGQCEHPDHGVGILVWVCRDDVSFGADGAIFDLWKDAEDAAAKMASEYQCSVSELLASLREVDRESLSDVEDALSILHRLPGALRPATATALQHDLIRARAADLLDDAADASDATVRALRARLSARLQRATEHRDSPTAADGLPNIMADLRAALTQKKWRCYYGHRNAGGGIDPTGERDGIVAIATDDAGESAEYSE
jgi:hypothetical protein